MSSTRRQFLRDLFDGSMGLGIAGASQSPAGRVVTNYLFGEDEEGFRPMHGRADLADVDLARAKIPGLLKAPATFDEAYNFEGNGLRYVLGGLDSPLGVAHVDVFESPREFMGNGYLAEPVMEWSNSGRNIFKGYRGGDVTEVVPSSFYNQGLDAVAGDVEMADLSRQSSRVLSAMINQARELGGEYTFVRVPEKEALRLHMINRSSSAIQEEGSVVLVYDAKDNLASYDAITF